MKATYNCDHLQQEFDDFLENEFRTQNDLSNCYLSEDALEHFLTPSQEKWKDFLPDENEAVVTMDSTKDKQWELAKKEIKHIWSRIPMLLLTAGDNDNANVDMAGSNLIPLSWC